MVVFNLTKKMQTKVDEGRQLLYEYANLIKQLLHSLAIKSITNPTPQQIMGNIIEKDKQLIKLVKEGLQIHFKDDSSWVLL